MLPGPAHYRRQTVDLQGHPLPGKFHGRIQPGQNFESQQQPVQGLKIGRHRILKLPPGIPVKHGRGCQTVAVADGLLRFIGQ